MNHFSSVWNGLRAGRGQWLSSLVGLLLLLVLPGTTWASHIRAGDIQARVDSTNRRHIFFRLTLYTDRYGVGQDKPVMQDSADIFFGDGSCTSQPIPRNTRLGGPKTEPIHITEDTDINYYYFDHYFNSDGYFTVSFIGENRVKGVLNISLSDTRTFYVSTRVRISPSLGYNHSAVLKAPAVDKGAELQVFLHNPGAFDADGDSLSFSLAPSQDVPLGVAGVKSCVPMPQTVPGYRVPSDQTSSPRGVQVVYAGPPAGDPGKEAIFHIDRLTGQVTWNSPGDAGIYNFAIKVTEWRRTSLGPYLIGEVIRDMQVIIKATNNLRPAIQIPIDTCVIAGANVIKTNITATDGSAPGMQPASPLVLTAFSGILPPATFTQTQAGPPLARGRFQWQTDCSNVAKQPYQVLFRVQDTPPQSNPPRPGDPPALIDERVWRVTVVGPPPILQIAPGSVTNGNTALLSWERYACSGTAAQPLRMLIFRKEGPSTFNPGPCDTGIPAGTGFQQIGSVGVDAQAFKDDNAGKGLERGKTYCYRIYVVFPLPAGGESIASNEACISFDGRAAMLTHVDVDRTSSTDGQITVRWTKPVAPKAQGSFKPPYSYRLSRGEGAAPATYTVIAPAITNLADTVYVDHNLNTLARQYTYKLEFVTQGATGLVNTETSPTASSVRLNATGQGLSKNVVLNWTYQVPWDNTAGPTVVFRRKATDGAFKEVGRATATATGSTFTDSDPTLELNQTYCYYVQTQGRYEDIKYLQSLLNKSQEFCVPLSSEPCAPVLAVRPVNCDSLAALPLFPSAGQTYENRLRWTLGNTPAGCTNDNNKYYRIFSRPTEEGTLVLRDSTDQLGYVDRNLPTNAACYAVQAVDVNGRRSPLSNIVCVDNCLFFVLPNIFTPNGDQFNNTFRPKVSSPVRRVRFQAFNRWGVKVYEGDRDPLINWDGGGSQGEAGNSSKLADGIYYYLAEVEFADFKNTKRTYKGWVEIRH
jgi:hypothetical protein